MFQIYNPNSAIHFQQPSDFVIQYSDFKYIYLVFFQSLIPDKFHNVMSQRFAEPKLNSSFAHLEDRSIFFKIIYFVFFLFQSTCPYLNLNLHKKESYLQNRYTSY